VLSHQQARARAAELLGKVVGELPGLLAARATAPTARDYDEEAACLRLRVRVGVEPKQYRRWVQRVTVILDRTSLSCSRFSFEAPAPGCPRPGGLQVDLRKSVARLSHRHADGRCWFLWLLSESGKDLKSTTWQAYRLDCKGDRVSAVLGRKPRLLVNLLDAEGKAIAKRTLSLPQTAQPHTEDMNDRCGQWFWFQAPRIWSGPRDSDTIPKHLLLAPIHFSPGLCNLHFNQAEVLKVEMPLAGKELARLRRVECSVTWLPASSSRRPAAGRRTGSAR
jgi:hypothetical protein